MISHLFTVFTSPRSTMERIRERPAWWVTLVALALVSIVGSAVIAHIAGPEQMELALNGPFGDRLAKDPNFQHRMDEAATPTMSARLRTGIQSTFGLLIAAVIGALIWHLVCRIAGGLGRWQQTLGVVFLGDWIAIGVGYILKTPLILAKGEAMTVTLSLAALVPDPDITKLWWRALSGFTDVLSVWGLIVTAIGISVVHGFGKGKAWAVTLVPWLFFMGIGLALGSLFM